MSKTANRAAAKAYVAEQERKRRDDAARAAIKAKLDTIGPFRDFLIKNAAPLDLLERLDDWVGDLAGDRSYFHSRDSSRPAPVIKLPHERS